MLIQIFYALQMTSLLSYAAPSTLLLDLRNNGHHRAIRPLADCQWVEADLNQALKPDMLNVGFGSVLRISTDLQIKVLGAAGKTVWQKVDVLPAYRDNNSLIQRFSELEKAHGKRGLFYETTENIEKIFSNNSGFALRPGDLIVSAGDPALLRFLFAAPVVEFFVLRLEVVDGIHVYKPSQERGAISMETLIKSATTIFPTHIMTMTAQRQQKKLAKAASCSDALTAKGQ